MWCGSGSVEMSSRVVDDGTTETTLHRQYETLSTAPVSVTLDCGHVLFSVVQYGPEAHYINHVAMSCDMFGAESKVVLCVGQVSSLGQLVIQITCGLYPGASLSRLVSYWYRWSLSLSPSYSTG